MKKTLILISCFLINYCHAQKKCFSKSWSLAITNAHTAKPFGSFAALAYENFHPGIEGGMQLIIKEKSVDSNRIKHQWLLNLKGGYMYHQWVQHNIALYATYGYRKYFLKTFSAELKAGGGYQQAFTDSKVFKLTDEGIKKKSNLRQVFYDFQDELLNSTLQ
jgi:hypothetical protein